MTRDEFLTQLRTLTEMKSVSENRIANKNLVRYVSSQISPDAVTKVWSNKCADILLASNVKTMRPDVAFLVHGDVVSGSDDLFNLKVVGDKLMGRGVSDMKFSIPIGVHLLNDWIKSKKVSSFAFVMTTDEEMGGFNGARVLAEKYKFNPKLLIVPDGGDNFELVYKSKGVVHVLVESKGKSSHASDPWFGRSAVTPLVVLAKALTDKYGVNGVKPNWDITCNIGQIHAGESTNQVCDYGYMKIDFRFPEKFTVNDILDDLKMLVSKEKLKLKISRLVFGKPTFTDPKLPELVSFKSIAEKIIGKKVKLIGDCGASDARYFGKSPILMMKPEGGGIHSNTEWVSLNSCMLYFEIIKKFINNIL